MLENLNGKFSVHCLSGGILNAIGDTPLVRLDRLMPDNRFNLFAKCEFSNPGGSVKDRPALNILREAARRGEITKATTVVESSSGNFGIGLAQICARLGLRFICVVDSRANDSNIKLMRTFGAHVEIIDQPDPESGELLQACLKRVQQLLQEIPNSFWPNQHGNDDNPMAHHRTMAEIAKALDDKVDYLFCATSTCGTLRGCAEYIKANHLPTKVYAVDALGSLIFSTQQAKRIIPGHGAGKPPSILREGLWDGLYHVSAKESVIGCRILLKQEAIMAGGSSGGIVYAVLRHAPHIEAGANCVMIIADRGERYLDTVFCDQWVRDQIPDFFDEVNAHLTFG